MKTKNYPDNPPVAPRRCRHDQGTYQDQFDEWIGPGESVPLGYNVRCNRCKMIIETREA